MRWKRRGVYCLGTGAFFLQNQISLTCRTILVWHRLPNLLSGPEALSSHSPPAPRYPLTRTTSSGLSTARPHLTSDRRMQASSCPDPTLPLSKSFTSPASACVDQAQGSTSLRPQAHTARDLHPPSPIPKL
eukprot:2625614-Rhodomonas_salina.4